MGGEHHARKALGLRLADRDHAAVAVKRYGVLAEGFNADVVHGFAHGLFAAAETPEFTKGFQVHKSVSHPSSMSAANAAASRPHSLTAVKSTVSTVVCM